jgi:hypothetical protein
MYSIQEVTPHQAVASPAENIQPGTTRHDQPNSVTMCVEETFEQCFPVGVFVQFVENRNGWFSAQAIQL